MTKTNIRKRAISILLILMVMLTMTPMTASAATTGNGTQGNPFVVTTFEDWRDAMQQSGETYIKLGANIDTSEMNGGFGLGSGNWVRVQSDIHLDLNGKKLTLLKSKIMGGSDDRSCFIMVLKGSLTIEDTQGGGEIIGSNQAVQQYMQLIDVRKDSTLTLNSGKLHLAACDGTYSPNAAIRFEGTVKINGGTVSVTRDGIYDEVTGETANENFALQAYGGDTGGCAMIHDGTFDGRVLLYAVAKASGTADNVITGGDFKKSIYIQKNRTVTGDVPLNVSIQGGTYHYIPGYRTYPDSNSYYPGKTVSDPTVNLQFSTVGFTNGHGRDVEYFIDFNNGNIRKQYIGNDNYDINAFASMFPKNAIITAEGQKYTFIRGEVELQGKIDVSDAVYTGASNATDLEPLVNSHYKTITVTTLPEDALKDMKLTVGNGTPLPAKGTTSVSGDVALGSGGTLTKNIYITATGNKQLKEMYYSNPSKIDFGYRLNILKDGERVDYTGVISQTYAAVGDEISVSVQLPNFEFEKGVYTFRLALHSDLRGSEAQIGKTLVGLWKLTAKEDVDLPIDSVTLDVPKLKERATSGGNFTLSGTNTGVSSTVNTVWEGIPSSGAVAGNFYAARITLMAEDGYAFNTNTQVNLNGDYLSKGSGIDNGGKGMTVYVNVPVRHEHTYGEWKIAGTGNVHFRECSCGAQESKPHEWKYLEGQDKYKCTVCGYEIDGEKERITYVYASPRSPIAGEHPGDYTPAEWVKIGGANYKVESIVWKNMDDTGVTTFEASKIYKGTVTFKADTGFAFDGGRIYANKIFNPSNAENVGNYTLADGGTTLTATFKLKDNTVVRPALNVKVKLPTLNDKIGQSFPAAELVDTTLPGDVELTSSVYENILDPAITGSVESNKTYFYAVKLQFKNSSDDITKAYNVSYTVTDGGDTEYHTDNLAGYGILARYQTPDTSKINSVALTVTAPKYGEAPATTATGANDTLYTVGTPAWSPAVTDGKFGAAAYIVSIPVTAVSGYNFDANCVYTINGYLATHAGGKVSYTFPQLTAPHAHTYGTWTMLDDSQHSRSCTACGDVEFGAHAFNAWTEDGTNHSRTCSKCKDPIAKSINYSETAAHTWVWVVDKPAEAGVAGKKHEKCTDCTATRNVGTVIPALPNHAASGSGSYAPTTQKPEITVIGSGKAELSADGKTATITAAAGHELVSVVLNGKEMGKVEKLTGLKTGDKVTITFRAKAGEKDGKEETDKMIAREVSKLRLTARSARTAKKNVKLVVKSDLKAITDAGYTVKYKFYRSTKKSAGYKAVLTKKAPTYVNTYGKKGTLYYYKVKVMVYDKDGNLIAQTALKQCKYASRLWTK